MTMTQILIVARDVLILWVNFAVMPAELAFDAIEAELKRRGLAPLTRSSDSACDDGSS
jgi:DNA phosphorothioation-dependent restriction protein DptG